MFAFPDLHPRKFTSMHAVIFVAVVAVSIVLGVVRFFRDDVPPTSDVPAVAYDDVVPEERGPVEVEPIIIPSKPSSNEISAITSVPAVYNLAVPFTSQAPTGNWDAVHEETCEEAAVYMVAEYFAGTKSVTLDTADADVAMLDLVAYEEANGYGVSVSVTQLADIIRATFNFTVEVVENPSADEIKAFIADGYPVIVPAAGRTLGNPFFTGEGPLYHMLVIRGYDETHFITNDPGTRHGANYLYTFDVLMSAIHDWNNGDPTTGAARVIVMKPVVRD